MPGASPPLPKDPDDFHVRFVLSKGLTPRNPAFRVSLLVNVDWFTRPDPRNVRLILGFQHGDVKNAPALCDIDQVSLTDIVGNMDVNLTNIFSACATGMDPFRYLLDTLLVMTATVEFSAGDREEHRITLPQDIFERVSHPIEMLLVTIRFGTGTERTFHLPLEQLRRFFIWEGSDAPSSELH